MSGVLASGLPRLVEDGEDLARFVLASDELRATEPRVKFKAFTPDLRNGATSVSRHGPTPKASLWALAPQREGRTVYGAAIVKASVVRDNDLDLHADDDPPRHANIIGWPIGGSDPEMMKARRKAMATGIADAATFIPSDPTP